VWRLPKLPGEVPQDVLGVRVCLLEAAIAFEPVTVEEEEILPDLEAILGSDLIFG